MTVEQLVLKKLLLESEIAKLLKDFHAETTILVTNIEVTTVQVNCGEVITGVKIEIVI